MRSLTSRSRKVFLWNMRLLRLELMRIEKLDVADFDSIGADDIAVAGNDHGEQIVAVVSKVEIAGFLEFAGKLDAGVDGIGAHKSGIGVDEGELVGDAGVGSDGDDWEVGALGSHG